MRLFRLSYKGLSSSPDGNDREILDNFFVDSLIEYLNIVGVDVPKDLSLGKKPLLIYGAHSKPYFESKELSGIFFSISHTKDFAGIVFAKTEIGFDCENLRYRSNPVERIRKISARVFAEDEKDYCYAIPGKVTERFFEIWTAKEAYSKYTGKGFTEGFSSFSVIDKIGKTIHTAVFEDIQIAYAICADETELNNNE